MARKRINRLVRGEHLVTTFDGDVRHSDQVTKGLYGDQRGRIVEIDELDGPDHEEMQRRSRERNAAHERRELRWPVTGSEDD